MKTTKKRRTAAQLTALKAYNHAVAQEDRYLGSVFVTSHGERQHAAKVASAYATCKALGIDYRHGL